MQKKSTILNGILNKIIFGIIVVLIWQFSYYIGVEVFEKWKPYAFPSPLGVVQSFTSLIEKGSLLTAIGSSLRRLVVGYTISLVVGLVLGLLIAKFKYLNENLKPMILGIQTLPSICWVPFAILWFGLNDNAILFVIIIGSTFSMSISVEQAIRNVNPLFIKAARTMGAKGKTFYTHVIIPASVPNLISGCKQGWSFAWRALMSGEVMFASKGLGQILTMGRDLADINQVMAVIITIVILGVLIDYIAFRRIERKIQKKWGLI